MDTDLDRPVRPEDFNETNSVVIFMGPLMDMYGTISLNAFNSLIVSTKRVTLLCVETQAAFKKGTARGGVAPFKVVNIPIGRIERDARSLINEDDFVIIYGKDGIGSPQSAVAADKLSTIGYEKLLRFDGTFEDWREACGLIEGTEKTLTKAA